MAPQSLRSRLSGAFFYGLGAANSDRARRWRLGEIPELETVGRCAISARPAAQRAMALKDRHKFKTEMDAEAMQAMFPHLNVKVA
jgi:hypothetical protein